MSNVAAAYALIQDNRSAAEYVGTKLNDRYSQFKGTIKRIAKAANANERAAETWLQARACPQVPRFLRLAMEVPELNAAVMWLMKNGPGHPEAHVIIEKMEAIIEAKGPE